MPDEPRDHFERDPALEQLRHVGVPERVNRHRLDPGAL
jgi:hypothetical protein